VDAYSITAGPPGAGPALSGVLLLPGGHRSGRPRRDCLFQRRPSSELDGKRLDIKARRPPYQTGGRLNLRGIASGNTGVVAFLVETIGHAPGESAQDAAD